MVRKTLLVPDRLVEQHIHTLLGQECLRLSPSSLMQILQARLPACTRPQVRSVIKSMILSGLLAYTHHFGSTQLELSQCGPVRISDRIALFTGQGGVPCEAGVSIVRIKAGASFGCGSHPTTRLALRGLDIVLRLASRSKPVETMTVLDLGTGSGVLAIAAAMLNVRHAVGIDVDPVACHEAAANVSINGVRQKVSIVCGSLMELSTGTFDVILANLRPPTLVQIVKRMVELTHSQGFWVLSGFRPDERPELEKNLPKFACTVWTEDERDWGAAGYRLL